MSGKTFFNLRLGGGLVLFLLTGFAFGQSGQVISASFGPPSQANTWEKYVIPLKAETFGVSETEFAQVMQSVQSFRIRTETADGPDVGAVDQVIIGNRYMSTFDAGAEGWNAAGDGTLEWVAAGGAEGGFLQISDWASGDWHYAVAPLLWSGDWSALMGQNIEFFFKTDRPDYGSIIEISSARVKRLILSIPSLVLAPGTRMTMTVSLSEPTSSGVAVRLNSHNTACAQVPASVVIAAGQSSAEFLVVIPETAQEGCSSVITAEAEGYASTRLTLKVGTPNAKASLKGRITDAVTGAGIPNALVSVAGVSTLTDIDGYYELTGISTDQVTANFTAQPRSGPAPLTVQFSDLSGTVQQAISISADGYVTYESTVSLSPGVVTTLNISLSPVITDNEYRIVLNWGKFPSDLDIYLIVPKDGFHDATYVYYSNRGWFNTYPYAVLDIDRRQGFGPETITIQRLIAGKYVIFVHNYSRDAELTDSEGIVQIYGRSGLLQSVSVPKTGTGPYWYIGDIDGLTGQMTIKNVIQEEQPRPNIMGLAKMALKSEPRGQITSWAWDFDDDGVVDATSRNPLWTYTNPGVYTVKLTVSDGVNSYVERKQNYITVTAAPPNELSGLQVSITQIDPANFPLIKCLVSVVDQDINQPVTDLYVGNFDVREENRPTQDLRVRKLDASIGTRADIVFVFDVTGSMGEEISGLKERVVEFADSLSRSGVDFRLGLITFGDEVLSISDFTSNPLEFKSWVEGLIADGGGDDKENALEGLAAAARLSFRQATQKVFILITDADYHEAGESGDGTTRYTTESIISLMREEAVQVNVVGPDLAQYTRMAEETGGQFYSIYTSFTQIIRRLGGWITSQYVVTYVPENTVADNTLRHVKVEVTQGNRGGRSTGVYFIGSAKLLLNPPTLLGKLGDILTVDVRVENVNNLSMANYVLSFDNNKLQALQAEEGDFFTQGGALSTFVPQINNSIGHIDISASRVVLNSDMSSGVSGSGLLARLRFKIINQDCAGLISFVSYDFRRPDDSKLTLVTAGTQIYSVGTVGSSAILCDFDQDLDIDTRDFALLATFWKPRNTPLGDVGPALGEPPFFTPQPDGVVNHEDLFVFTRMWNWYHGAISTYGGLAKNEIPGYRLETHLVNDGLQRVTIVLTNVAPFAMGRVIVQTPAGAALQAAREGLLLTADGSAAAVMVDKIGLDSYEIAFARLAATGKPAQVSGSGSLLTFDLKGATGEASVSLLELRSARNQPIYIKAELEESEPALQVPKTWLLSGYPNPFNSRTVIEVGLPIAGEVKLNVVNVLGRPVRQLIDRHLEAGVHKVIWDGTDDDGRACAGGMYLLLLQAGGQQITRKIVYLK
ncbi:MAG: VWA domain-containing protein [candidate division KSB1 bacterium]|nr:VWA domain-containing protein [candidate division KSB1 bacterium]